MPAGRRRSHLTWAPNSPVAEAIDPGRAATLCFAAIGQNQREAALANCTADVAVTGEPGFAKTYALSAEARAGLVAVTLGASSQVSAPMDPVTFTADEFDRMTERTTAGRDGRYVH